MQQPAFRTDDDDYLPTYLHKPTYVPGCKSAYLNYTWVGMVVDVLVQESFHDSVDVHNGCSCLSPALTPGDDLHLNSNMLKAITGFSVSCMQPFLHGSCPDLLF